MNSQLRRTPAPQARRVDSRRELTEDGSFVPSTSTSARSKPAGIWARAPLPLAGQRPNEIAVRVALGGQRSSIVRIVIGEGLRLSLGGIGFRLLGTIALGAADAQPAVRGEPERPDHVHWSRGAPWCRGYQRHIPAHRAAHCNPMVVLRRELRSNTLASSSTVE